MNQPNYDKESNFLDYKYENALVILDEIIENIKHEFFSSSFNSKISTLGGTLVKREGGIQTDIQSLLHNYLNNQNSDIVMLYEILLKDVVDLDIITIENDILKRLKRRKVDFIFKNKENENLIMIEAKHINKIDDIKTQIESLVVQLNDIKITGEVGVGMLVYSGEIEILNNNEYTKDQLKNILIEYREEINKNLNDNYVLNTDLFDIRFNNNGKISFVCIDFLFDKTFYYKFTDNNYIDLYEDRYFEDLDIDSEIEYGNIIKLNETYYLLIDDFIEFINENGDWIDFIEPSYISLRKKDNLNDLMNKHYFKPNHRYGY